MAKESINIRIARTGDHKFFKKIEESTTTLFKEYGCDFSNIESPEEEFYLSIEGKHEIYVAHTSDNKIVGFCAIKTIDSNAYIIEISLLPDYRKKGIGTKLIEHATFWAEINKYEYITLTTFRDLPFNGEFYKKLGFNEFTPDSKWPALKRIRENEKQSGLEILPRIAMRKSLK